MSYKIVTDTCCDFPTEMYKELDLAVCPMGVLYKGEVYSEYSEQWLKDLYEGMRHEIHNELDRQSVYNDLLAYIEG